jgi:hypothetical protein
LFVRVFSRLLPDHRKLSDYEAELRIPFQTPGQWAEQIGGTLPALKSTQNDQWRAPRIPLNEGGVYQ